MVRQIRRDNSLNPRVESRKKRAREERREGKLSKAPLRAGPATTRIHRHKRAQMRESKIIREENRAAQLNNREMLRNNSSHHRGGAKAPSSRVNREDRGVMVVAVSPAARRGKVRILALRDLRVLRGNQWLNRAALSKAMEENQMRA